MQWIIYAMCYSVTFYCLALRVRENKEKVERILERNVYIRIYPSLANAVVFAGIFVLSALFPMVWISYISWKIHEVFKKK